MLNINTSNGHQLASIAICIVSRLALLAFVAGVAGVVLSF